MGRIGHCWNADNMDFLCQLAAQSAEHEITQITPAYTATG